MFSACTDGILRCNKAHNFVERKKTFFSLSWLTKSPWKCPETMFSQMFISITEFDIGEADDSHILITLIDAMSQFEETKRFNNKAIFDDEKWIQVGYLTPRANSISNAVSISNLFSDLLSIQTGNEILKVLFNESDNWKQYFSLESKVSMHDDWPIMCYFLTKKIEWNGFWNAIYPKRFSEIEWIICMSFSQVFSEFKSPDLVN